MIMLKKLGAGLFILLSLNISAQYKVRDIHYAGDLFVITGIVMTSTSFFSSQQIKADGYCNYREQVFYAGIACLVSGITYNVIQNRRYRLDFYDGVRLTIYLDNGLFREGRGHIPKHTAYDWGRGSRHGRLSADRGKGI